MERREARAGGFTLIELMIVVAIAAAVAAAAAPAIASLSGANVRGAAGELAAATRFLFDTAALRHETCRLTLDLDKRAWWAECTEARQGGRRSQPVVGKDGTAEDDEALAERFPEEKDAERRRFLARARFAEFKDREVRRRELPGSAAFAGVRTPRERDLQSRGIAHVYFFPQGQVDPAQIGVADGETAYTVVTAPLTGRARVVAGRPEALR
jgi:general secretion pathway protein H